MKLCLVMYKFCTYFILYHTTGGGKQECVSFVFFGASVNPFFIKMTQNMH